MGEIHACVRQKRKDCAANAYWQCLHEEGLHAEAYTALVNARNGLFLINVNDMYIGASLLLYGEWSEQEVIVMGLNLLPDSIVVDVGANIGAMTVPLARRVPKGRVIAFEPQRIVSQILSANLQLNGLVNVDVRRAVAGMSGATSTIDVPEMNPATVNNFGGLSLISNTKRTASQDQIRGWNTVPSTPLDSLHLPKIDLLKVDAQGMEAQVLEGGRLTIERDLPVLYMEYESKSRDLYNVVKSLGPYECYHHSPHIYDPHNFRKEKMDIFPNMRSFNIFCVARPDSIVPDWLAGKNLESFDLPEIQAQGAR